PNSEIRLTAVQTLGEIGSGKATEFIRFMLEKEEDDKVVEAGKKALVSIREKVELEENA
ncbi:MAG: HEAT repeat domain-containing protein, partial [Clostridiaceae bacterium]|nr:HEAT repeat domain-containing protein [Clostridiaceae bacterium]